MPKKKSPEEIRGWAQECSRLRHDESLLELLSNVRHTQHVIFEDPNSTEQQVMDAHYKICAIKEIVAEMDRGIKQAQALEHKT